MKFIVVFTYMDGEEYEIHLQPSCIESFMASLGKSEVFFNNESGSGVWIPISKIRHFHVEKVDEQGKRVVVSNSGLQKEREATTSQDVTTGENGGEAVERAE
jgi:hypothetical protein